MKSLPQKLIVFLVVLYSCNNDTAINTSKSAMPAQNTEAPKKKIAEQFSSTDRQLVSEQSSLQKPTAEVKKVTTDMKATSEAKKPAVVKPKAPQVQTPKVEKVKQIVRSAEIEFDEYLFDFGEIIQGDKVDHKFTFKNTGNAPLTITKADATCGCATPSIPFMDIMPGEVGYIGVNYNSMGKEGKENPQVTIFSNASKNPNLVLKLKGFVKVPVEEEEVPETVDSLKTAKKDTTKVEGLN